MLLSDFYRKHLESGTDKENYSADYNDNILKELTDNVVHLDSADSQTLKSFFKWVSETIEQGNKSQGTGESVTLPPPPSEITVVI
jgi:uncharacterized protein YegL